MIRMLALDLDDTTLQQDGTLSETTRQALTEVIALGVCVVVASGRSYAALPEEIRLFPGIRYAVVSNGAAVYDLQNETILRALTVPEKAVLALLSMADEESDFLIEAGIQGRMYAPAAYVADPQVFRHNASISAYLQRTRKPVEDMKTFLQMHSREIDCVDLICADSDRKEQLFRQVQQKIPNIYVTSSTPQLVEIAHAEAGKASGIRFLAHRTGIPAAQIMACGNADNDMDMLAYAGLGVAVANATPHCLLAADAVTDSNTEDGVAKAIRQYILYGSLSL